MRALKIIIAILWLAQAARKGIPQVTSSALPPPVCSVTAADLLASLQLSVAAFDQDLQGGWRKLAMAGCEISAAMLIDSFVTDEPDAMTPIARGNLYWHAGQLYAIAGLSPLARRRFIQSLDRHEVEGASLAWNAYVLGSAAFLARDKQELSHQRDVLASARATDGNKMNLVMLERLLGCFDKPYKDAYSSEDCYANYLQGKR